MSIEDNIIDSFNEDDQLVVKEGGKKWNPFETAANKAKDIYYQSLFSAGEKLVPAIEKALGAESAADATLLLRYLSGSGEEMPLSEDQNVIDAYLQAVHRSSVDASGSSTREWQPTTNTELNPNSGVPYADEGWEFTQIDPREVMKFSGVREFAKTEKFKYSIPTLHNDLYNKLGDTSSVRRRKLEGGKYEYMIVEPWDLLKGSEAVDEGDLVEYAQGYGRNVPKALGFLQKFAPDFLKATKFSDKPEVGINLNMSDYGKDWLENKAKPFNITGSSIINQ